MSAVYNDNDKFACAWLRNLMEAGEITEGTVDERDIQELRPGDLEGYERVHLCAGIGGWDLAARLAGWAGPLWTASFPCQPFSAAGRRKAFEDERHLWPIGLALIEVCRPPTIFGEQVVSADGRVWLDRVRADLETLGYAVGAADLCSAGSGGPNIRQRLFWVAYAAGREQRRIRERGARQGRGQLPAGGHGSDSPGVAESECSKRQPPKAAGSSGDREAIGWQQGADRARGHRPDSARLADTDCQRPDRQQIPIPERQRPPRPDLVETTWSGCVGFWSDFDLVHCTDGSARRTQPGLQPLAHGLPRSLGPGGTRSERMGLMAAKANRIGRLKGYGNSINPWLAAEFMKAFMDVSAAA